MNLDLTAAYMAIALYAECVRTTARRDGDYTVEGNAAWQSALEAEGEAWRVMAWFNHGDREAFTDFDAGKALVRLAALPGNAGDTARHLLSWMTGLSLPVAA